MTGWKLFAQMNVTEKDGTSSVFRVSINEARLWILADDMAERGISIIEMGGGVIGLTLLPEGVEP